MTASLRDTFLRYPAEVPGFAVIPDAALEVLLDFWWDQDELHRGARRLPVEQIHVPAWTWVLQIPFGRTKAGPYTCTMQQVLMAPHLFMGRSWDTAHGGRDGWIQAFVATFREVHRVLKPGAHGLVWAIPRTSHWTATALEDAGFEVRDIVHRHHGQASRSRWTCPRRSTGQPARSGSGGRALHGEAHQAGARLS